MEGFIEKNKFKQIEDEIIQLKPENQYNYNEKRHLGENDSYICSLIREDSVETNNISPSSIIKQSIFETNSFLIDKTPTLIEYSAFYGSIQIFRYLFMNKAEIKGTIWLYAIHSNNAELIHLLEENLIKPNNDSYFEIFLESIKCHHNDVANYIKDNYLPVYDLSKQYKINDDILFYSAKYHNYSYFPDDFNNYNSFLFYLCKYDYSDIINILKKYQCLTDKNSSLRQLANKNELLNVYHSLSKRKRIPDECFQQCDKLIKIPIPSSIRSIGEYSFDGCTSLTQIFIPISVKSIGRCAFYECSSLSKIYIPSSVTKIEPYTFSECQSLQRIIIPSSVISIGEYAFDGCISLKKITIPTSVETIGEGSFYECTSLAQISILQSITTIKHHTFYGCSSLTHINIPSKLTSIEKSAFKKCISLTHITIPSSVTSIGGYAFYRCSSLTQISIPSSVNSNGDSVFNGHLSLAKIPIPSSVNSIGGYAFYGCSSLTQISIPSSVNSIENNAFERCSSLTQITIPSSVNSIGDNAFEGCSSLKQISIPSSVKKIGNSAFYGCSSLEQITFEIPSSVTSIGNNTFNGCSSLTQILIPSSITKYGIKIFEGISKIKIIGDMKTIPYELFSDCTSLTEIIIPSSVKTIEDYAFYNCRSLQQVTIEKSSSLNSIGNFVFYNCFPLKEITIPSSIISKSDYSFYISPNNMRRMKRVSMIKEDDICEHYLVEDKNSKKLFDEIIFHQNINYYSKTISKQIIHYLFSLLQINHPLIQNYIEFDVGDNKYRHYLHLLTEYINQRNLREIFENPKTKMIHKR